VTHFFFVSLLGYHPSHQLETTAASIFSILLVTLFQFDEIELFRLAVFDAFAGQAILLEVSFATILLCCCGE